MADLFTEDIHLMDESFDPRETGNYGLAILMEDSRITFCILDFRRNKFLGLRSLVKAGMSSHPVLMGQKLSFGDFLDAIYAGLPWLKNPFRQIRIALDTVKSTLVPAPIYDPDEMGRYLEFNFRPGKDEKVASDHLLSMDSFNIYAAPAAMMNALHDLPHESSVVSCSSLLIESIWINFKNRLNSPRVFLHMRHGHFDILVFDGRQMTYFNTFSFVNPDDVVYYLIFVMEQLDLNPEIVPVVLTGAVDQESALTDMILRYVRHVDFGKRSDAYKYSYVLNQLPRHRFYPLFNFFSCGL